MKKSVVLDGSRANERATSSERATEEVFEEKRHSDKLAGLWANGPLHTSMGQRPMFLMTHGISANGATHGLMNQP